MLYTKIYISFYLFIYLILSFIYIYIYDLSFLSPIWSGPSQDQIAPTPWPPPKSRPPEFQLVTCFQRLRAAAATSAMAATGRGRSSPNAIFDDPRGIPLLQTMHRDSPALFQCIYCGKLRPYHHQVSASCLMFLKYSDSLFLFKYYYFWSVLIEMIFRVQIHSRKEQLFIFEIYEA